MRSNAIAHYDSYAAWRIDYDRNAEKYEGRRKFEQSLIELDKSDLWSGWCGLCEKATEFRLPSKDSGAATNLREEMVCGHCNMNARVRAALLSAKQNGSAWGGSLYITEQGSCAYVWLQRNLRHVVGSEYLHDPEARSRMAQYLRDLGGEGDIRFEDVTDLTFQEASLDVIASFDVLEHIPDYRKALREFARTLRPGGLLVLTAPFICANETTSVRARLKSDGEIEHLLPPEYHGDPRDGGGILCFYHFGWDLLDAARAAGFSKAGMALPWTPSLGLMGQLWTLVAAR